MATSLTAFWSAIAATGSAYAAWMSYKINERNGREAVRPELVLEGWGYDTRYSNVATVTVEKIRNVGRGPAYGVTLFTGGWEHDREATVMECLMPFLAPNQEGKLSHIYPITWLPTDKVEIHGGGTNHEVDMDFKIFYSDSLSNRYLRTITVTATNGSEPGVGYELVPKLHWIKEKVTLVHSWRDAFGERRSRLSKLSSWSKGVVTKIKEWKEMLEREW